MLLVFRWVDGFLFCKLIEEIDAGEQSSREGDLNGIRVGFGSSGPNPIHQLNFNSDVQGSGECSP